MENLVKAKSRQPETGGRHRQQYQIPPKTIDAQYSTLNKTTGGADAEAEGILYQIMQLDDQLQKSRIVNPQAGTVLVKYAEPGEGQPPVSLCIKIADTDLLYLRAYITSDQLSTLKQGQTVRVFADYGEDDRREYP